ncbi:MAG: NUDIX domain-containing protein [Candidatus Stygibacter frigidus]|nr:NUDIX domain-containing protein [Candidatus Stygibacter frigidus]
MQKIRNSIKAIIIENNRILTIKCHDHNGEFYVLPGGGQQLYELMRDALMRECREEINCEVEVGRLLYIREYLADNHEFAETDNGAHQIDFMFECKLKEGSIPQNGTEPDPWQESVEWLEISRLMEYKFYPQKLRKILMEDKNHDGKIYLGDIN